MTDTVVIAALYQFKSCPQYKLQLAGLRAKAKSEGLKGTLIFSQEGINGTVAGSRAGIEALKAYLIEVLGFTALEYKESFFDKQPFYRLKVLLKPEIVTLGRPDISPQQLVGTYLSPNEWHDLLSANEEALTVIDVRNDYEVKIGSFKGAMNPKTETFKAFPDFVKAQLDPKKHQKIAMFCTGGIRCEKASSYLLSEGFETVYHLKGGILAYLEQIPPEKSLWEGECFVFDQRVAVQTGVKPGHYALCYACREPVSEADKQAPEYEMGVSCPACYGSQDELKRQRLRERHKQVVLAEARGEQHIGSTQRQEA